MIFSHLLFCQSLMLHTAIHKYYISLVRFTHKYRVCHHLSCLFYIFQINVIKCFSVLFNLVFKKVDLFFIWLYFLLPYLVYFYISRLLCYLLFIVACTIFLKFIQYVQYNECTYTVSIKKLSSLLPFFQNKLLIIV